jgi:hypothetical protein
MKLEFSRQILEKYSNIILSAVQWQSSCSMRADGRTDRLTQTHTPLNDVYPDVAVFFFLLIVMIIFHCFKH